MYASLPAWRAVERLQQNILPYQAKTLRGLWQRLGEPASLVDLGCGTCQLSGAVFSGVPRSPQYVGVDLDPGALALARERAGAFNGGARWIAGDAFGPLPHAPLFWSLSNTLLSLGGRQPLSQFLARLAQTNPGAKALWSIVPWDQRRAAYHDQFQDWIEYVPGHWFRAETRREGALVHQSLFLRDADQSLHEVKHSFLALSVAEAEETMRGNGWEPLGWIHPFTGEEVTPAREEIPEFFLLCGASK